MSNKVFYAVSCIIQSEEKAEEWVSWLIGKHLEDVCNAGALNAELIQISSESDEEYHFEVHYHFSSQESYYDYLRDHATNLRAEGLSLFPPEDGFAYERKAGSIISAHNKY